MQLLSVDAETTAAAPISHLRVVVGFGQVDRANLMFLVTVPLVSRSMTSSTENPAKKRPRREAVAAVCCVVIGAIFAANIAAHRDEPKKESLQFLLANMLQNQQWPLNSRVHPSLKPLETGRWMVILVRGDCGHCRELLESEFADPRRHRPNERTVVFVAGSENWSYEFDAVRLDTDETRVIAWNGDEPFVANPAVFVIDSGVVKDGRDGDDALTFIKQLFDELPDGSAR